MGAGGGAKAKKEKYEIRDGAVCEKTVGDKCREQVTKDQRNHQLADCQECQDYSQEHLQKPLATTSASPPRSWEQVSFLAPSYPKGSDLIGEFLKGNGVPLLLPRQKQYECTFGNDSEGGTFDDNTQNDSKEKTASSNSQVSHAPVQVLSQSSPQREILAEPPTSIFGSMNVQPSQEERQTGSFSEDPIPEPLSWRGIQIAPSMEESAPASEGRVNDNYIPPQQNLSESVGLRHCRFGRCPCTHFVEDRTRPTTCSTCSHGEMYHRSNTEAPLCRVKVKGGGDCSHCNLPILGNGFSGWYKEIKSRGIEAIVHEECYELYKNSIAPKCAHCSLPIRKTQGFSGRYSRVRVSESEKKKVHKECLDAFLSVKS